MCYVIASPTSPPLCIWHLLCFVLGFPACFYLLVSLWCGCPSLFFRALRGQEELGSLAFYLLFCPVLSPELGTANITLPPPVLPYYKPCKVGWARDREFPRLREDWNSGFSSRKHFKHLFYLNKIIWLPITAG